MMKQDKNNIINDGRDKQEQKNLPEAALRALAEAQERRQAAADDQAPPPRELGGRGGQDPARYGDWEIKGRAIDF